MDAVRRALGRGFWNRAMLVCACCIVMGCATDTASVSPEQRDAFMEQWAEYEAFRIPMDPKDEPLLLAALEKDPTGPWAQYILMKFTQAGHDAREKQEARARAAVYHSALRYLVPARDTLANAAASDPADELLKYSLREVQEAVDLACFEAGIDPDSIGSATEGVIVITVDPDSWDYGNQIYEQNTKLGRKALRKGNIGDAKQYLLAAGRTPGSPQLNSFGPDLTLARELAERGEYETVIEFLDLVARFWANPEAVSYEPYKRDAANRLKMIESWKEELRAGKIPDHRKWR